MQKSRLLETLESHWPLQWWDSTDTIEVLEELFSKTKKIVTVYVAGPYTNGDTGKNIQAAIDMAEKLFALGYMPFAPHLNHYLASTSPTLV